MAFSYIFIIIHYAFFIGRWVWMDFWSVLDCWPIFWWPISLPKVTKRLDKAATRQNATTLKFHITRTMIGLYDSCMIGLYDSCPLIVLHNIAYGIQVSPMELSRHGVLNTTQYNSASYKVSAHSITSTFPQWFNIIGSDWFSQQHRICGWPTSPPLEASPETTDDLYHLLNIGFGSKHWSS